MQSRRFHRSKRTYDLCFRAEVGLPLPPRPLTTLLIESALARAARNQDIVISHYVWMSNHPHVEVFSLDAEALANFHGYTKKRLTDSLKRLLGLRHLHLWEDRSTVAEVLDLEAAIGRIVYAYVNPARAGLGPIEKFQGCNTWQAFLAAPPEIDAVIEKEVPYVLMTDIEPLSSPNPSPWEERAVIEDLKEKAGKRTETLRIYPFKWLAAYGITDPVEIEMIRQRIIRQVQQEQEKLLIERRARVRRLEGFDVTNRYVPKEKRRKVHHYGSTKEIRLAYLESRRRKDEQCRLCYQRMKLGEKNVPWPPDAFPPRAPRLVNAL